MKQLLYVVTILGLLVGGASNAIAVSNEDVITDAQITMIRNNCTNLQATLNQIRQSDTLLRNNRGPLYRLMADKLMAPLNQRVVSNQLDGSELVATTAKFNAEYRKFFDAYKTYDSALATTLTTDCKKVPTTFYDQLMDARSKRQELHKINDTMVNLLTQYKKQFDVFEKEILDGGQNG